MRIITYLFWILVILLGVSFALLNSRSVEIHYYAGKVELYLPLLLLIELVIGAFLGVIAMLPKIFKLKGIIRKSRLQIKQLENELHALRPTETTEQEGSE